jgi:hypothetical protein
MNQGPATTILDYTNDLSMLLIGLIGVVWLSAVICVWMAIQHYYSSRMQHPIVDMPVDTPSLTTDQQDAA